jgi:hypothetical protein
LRKFFIFATRFSKKEYRRSQYLRDTPLLSTKGVEQATLTIFSEATSTVSPFFEAIASVCTAGCPPEASSVCLLMH